MLKNQKELNDKLLIASSQNSSEEIELLLKQGAEINCCDESGRFPIHRASEKGHVATIKILAKLGGDVNKTDNNGNTALMLAADNGHVEAIKALCELGAEIDKADNDGRTALILATDNDHVEAIETLLELGADINLQTEKEDGAILTSLIIAIENNNRAVTKCLLENGANYDGLDLQNKPDLVNEIEKIKKTKAVFAGDLSIPYDQINEKHLRYLCKQSGIPDHLLTTDENKPQSERYVDLVEKFKTSEADKKDDLNVLLGELLHHDDPFDFPAVAGFDMLSNSKFMTGDNARKTIESYEKNPHLKPENFLTDNGYDEKLAILIRNPQQTDNFFLTTKNWIIPQQQHDFLQKLKKEYFDITPSIKALHPYTLSTSSRSLLALTPPLRGSGR